MNDRWRVEHGSLIGMWRVYRGSDMIATFANWARAVRYARQEAVYEGLGIISLEITS